MTTAASVIDPAQPYARTLGHSLGEISVLIGAADGSPSALRAAAWRLDLVVSDLRDLQLEVAPPQRTDLAAIASAAADRAAATPEARPLQLLIADDLPAVHADPVALGVALEQLLRSALAAARSAVTATLTAEQVGDRVVIRLGDDAGQGDDGAWLLPPPEGRSRGRGPLVGAGVSGLVARRVVAAHGGTIAGSAAGRTVETVFDVAAA